MLQEKCAALTRRIEIWRKIQELYLPVATPLFSAASSPSDATSEDDELENNIRSQHTSQTFVKAEDIQLWLPSELPASLRVADSIKAVASREVELHKAQAYDALANIRRLHRTIAGISVFKKLNLVNEGQKTNTQLQDYYDKFNTQVRNSVHRYRAAWSALIALGPFGDWTIHLKELRNADVRGPSSVDDDDDPKSVGEGRRKVLWIWLVYHANPDTGTVAEDFSDAVRVEWARTKARGERWKEEVALLQEEMRRTLVFLEWKTGWWRTQGGCRSGDTSPELQQGLHAYALKQVLVLDDLRTRFAKKWYKVLMAHGISLRWASKHVPKDGDGALHVGGASDEEDQGDDSSDQGDDSSDEEDEGSSMDVDRLPYYCYVTFISYDIHMLANGLVQIHVEHGYKKLGPPIKRFYWWVHEV